MSKWTNTIEEITDNEVKDYYHACHAIYKCFPAVKHQTNYLTTGLSVCGVVCVPNQYGLAYKWKDQKFGIMFY